MKVGLNLLPIVTLLLLRFAWSTPLKSQYVEVPFAQLRQIVVIEISPADQSWLGSCSLKTVKKNTEYELIGTKYPNGSATRVKLIENFRFPKTIEQEMQSMDYKVQPVRTSSKKWGKVYSWDTPTSGSRTYLYLCASKNSHCFRVEKAGLSELKFDLRTM